MAGAARAASAPRGAAARRASGQDGLFGVPERFMRPRVVFIAVTAVIVGFGLLMVYSASSVTALADFGDSAYYLKRQLLFAAVGTAAAVFLAWSDYHLWSERFVNFIWACTILLLLLVFITAGDAYGATRWIAIGGFQLQPSEFAKITIVLVAASLAQRYFEEGTIDWWTFVKLMAIGVGLPIVLIVLQPDKGSTMVLGITIVTMGYLAGVPKRILAVFLVLGVLGFLGLSLRDDYSRQRLLTMLNPESDPYGAGYQLLQGFYAFGSGGLFGVGIGFSKQKYSYLPMAHNDFIFAVIGEECGLLGTLGLLAGFALFAWAGFRIALHAPDLAGRLIAAGCTALVVIQMLLNVAGVIGIFPLSGKPIPFVSYGGSSVIASLMLAGMVVSVSAHSHLPETAHDGARRSLRVTEGDAADAGLSLVGEPRPRSARGADAGRGPRLTVMDGGARGRAAGRADGRPAGRVTTDARGRRRVDLGPDAAERLRGRRGPRGRR